MFNDINFCSKTKLAVNPFLLSIPRHEINSVKLLLDALCIYRLKIIVALFINNAFYCLRI